MINDHLYEGRFTPTNADGKRISRNIYAQTTDKRGMRRKARRTDKDDESGNCGDEKGSEERIRKEGRPHISA